jgi:threonine/homoserine/homoserine lactone efflux protein
VTPGLESLIPFAGFWLVAIITPGPNTLLFSWAALSHGRAAAIAVTAGILSCGVLWAFGGLFGLVWALRQFPELFRGIELAGGLYIGWRGLSLLYKWWSSSQEAMRPNAPSADISPAAAYRMGFLTNLSNPKSLVFVASLFATTSVARGPLWLGLTGVGVMLGMSALYYVTLLGLFSRPGFLAAYQRARHRIEALAGAFFMWFGIELLWRGSAGS